MHPEPTNTCSTTAAAALALGIDVGGKSVKSGLCRGDDVVEKLAPIDTESLAGPEELVSAIIEQINDAQSRHPGVRAVGVGVPGFVDAATGVVHRLTNVPGWLEVPLRDQLAEATGLPTTVENDANSMAFAEFRFGAGRGSRHMVAATLGTGVGGGVILDGKLFRGARSGAGEIGQMSVAFSGVTGAYGNTGALERYVGIDPIAARARVLYAEVGLPVPEDCSPACLSAAATDGDAVALRLWDEVTTQLACGLANCVWLLNPEVIVIGGGISKAGDTLLFEPLRRKVHDQLAPTFRDGLRIEPARFGNEAGIIGSAAVALDAAAGN